MTSDSRDRPASSHLDPSSARRVSDLEHELARLRRDQEELREVREHLRAVLDTAIDGIVSIDPLGVVVSFNAAAERMFGFSAAEVLGQSVNSLMPAPFCDEHDGHLARYRETRTPRVLGTVREVVGLRRDGTTFPVEIGLRERQGSRGGFTAVLRDLSERRRLEGELRQAQRLETVGRLASGLAHESKNLFMGIGGLVSMALEHMDDSPARAYVEEVLTAIGRGSALTAQLLAVSRPGDPNLQPVVLDDKVRDIARLLQALLREDIELEVDLGAPGAAVAAGGGWVDQILLNLAVNASDALPHGGRLSIHTAADAEAITLVVRDTGTGMDEETRARVFEPFFTTKPTGKGTGLGLSAVRSLVDDMGGDVVVDSEVGQGTVFTLALPRARTENDTSPAHTPSRAARRPQRSRTILVVEDEPLVLITVEHYLRRAGYRPLMAASVDEALESAREHAGRVDLLLTDVSLPKLGGRELARLVAEHCPEVPVLFMSAFTRHQLLQERRIDPDCETIEKPFDEEDLLERLSELLDGSNPANPPG